VAKKKVKYPLIEIRQKKGSKGPMVGANTEVFMDGKRLAGATKVSFEVEAIGVAKVKVELLGQVVIVGKLGQYETSRTKIQTKGE
jgi:hypothetical protein